jgi:hypothetical protein
MTTTLKKTKLIESKHFYLLLYFRIDKRTKLT